MLKIYTCLYAIPFLSGFSWCQCSYIYAGVIKLCLNSLKIRLKHVIKYIVAIRNVSVVKNWCS